MNEPVVDLNGMSAELLLFVAGDAPRSRRARANLQRVLTAMGANAPRGPREIDLLLEPLRALDYGVFATPALLHVPDGCPPSMALYGDLSDEAALRRFIEDALQA